MTGHVRTRLACDRCHGQKLRCPKQAGSPICSRCAKAGVACVFSPAGPSSRSGPQSTPAVGHGLDPVAAVPSLEWPPTSSNDMFIASLFDGMFSQSDSSASTTVFTAGDPPAAIPSTLSACIRELSDLLLQFDASNEELFPASWKHLSVSEVRESALIMPLKYSQKASLEQILRCAHRLGELYPVATKLALPPNSTNGDGDCNVPDCVHKLTLPSNFPETCLSLGTSSHEADLSLITLLVSCHSRFLDVLAQLMRQMLLCLKIAVSSPDHEEPEFDVPELRLGSFLIPKASAAAMMTNLIIELQETLIQRLCALSQAASKTGVKNETTVTALLQDLRTTAKERVTRLRDFKSELNEAGYLKFS